MERQAIFNTFGPKKSGKHLFEKLVNYRIHQSQDSQVAGEDLRRETDASISLFEFYKENLPAPISKEDADLFYGFTTNNIISFASYRSDNFSEFIKIVSEFRNKGLFNVSAISARGVYYFIKAILKFITI